MREVVVDETMMDMDKDQDGYVELEEYISKSITSNNNMFECCMILVEMQGKESYCSMTYLSSVHPICLVSTLFV